jgi:hypothetical protein
MWVDLSTAYTALEVASEAFFTRSFGYRAEKRSSKNAMDVNKTFMGKVAQSYILRMKCYYCLESLML